MMHHYHINYHLSINYSEILSCLIQLWCKCVNPESTDAKNSGPKHVIEVTYSHVFSIMPFQFLNHDILQNLIVQDFSEFQAVFCKI